MTKEWIGTVLIMFVVVGLFSFWQVWERDNEIAELRRERISADSLKKVAENQYELKVREVESQETLLKDVKAINADLAKELDKRDLDIVALTSLVIQLRADTGHGHVDAIDSSKGRVDFTLESNNKIVLVKGYTQISPKEVKGIFSFATLPTITIVLYEDELKYINARVVLDDRVATLVSFHTEAYKPKPIEEGWRWIAGFGIARTFYSGLIYGPAAIGGATWREWGLAGMVAPNSIGIMLLKTF